MSNGVEIYCPHCETTLSLKSRRGLGKSVKCPRCSQPFLAREYSQEFEVVDDILEYENAFPNHPESDSRGYTGTPPSSNSLKKRRRRRMSRRWKITLIIGSVVSSIAAVTVIIALVLVASSREFDVGWLPEDADRISVGYYSDLWWSGVIQKMAGRNNLNDGASKMKNNWGFGPSEIASFTVASSNDSEKLKILRTTVDIDQTNILRHVEAHSEVSYKGRSYFRVGTDALYFPDKRTVISGTEASVRKAIERGPKTAKRKDLEFVNADHQIVSVHVDSEGFFPNVFGEFTKTAVTGRTIGISYVNDAKITLSLMCDTAADAKAVADEARKNIDEWKRRIANRPKENSWNLSREFEPGLWWTDAAPNSIRVSRSRQVALISFRVKSSSMVDFFYVQPEDVSFLQILFDPRKLFAVQFSPRQRLRVMLKPKEGQLHFSQVKRLWKGIENIDPEWSWAYGDADTPRIILYSVPGAKINKDALMDRLKQLKMINWVIIG